VVPIKLSKIEEDWNEAYNGFYAYRWECFEDTSNPKSCSLLHFVKFLDIVGHTRTLEEPKLETIYGYACY